jgi:hypothetical protein
MFFIALLNGEGYGVVRARAWQAELGAVLAPTCFA